MPPERYPLSQDDGDGGGGGGVGSLTVNGGTTIIGGHVTVETSSPVASPSPGKFDATVATPISNGSSMVLSTIPVETTHQLILQQHLAAHPAQHHIITTGNSASNPSAISSGVSAGNTGIIINNNNNNTSFKNHNNIIISSSGALATSNSNNHTYTINLSSGSHAAGGHAVITNGIPLQGYTSVTTSSNNNNSTTLNHSHHHHQQQQQQQQYHHLHPASNSSGSSVANMATVHGNGTTTTTTVAGQTTVVAPQQNQQQQPSKLVVLQQGHLGENYITTTEGMNGVGNIVLLATEQMDSSDHEILNGSSSVGNNLVITSSSSSSSSSNHGHQLSHHQHHAIRSAAATLTSNGVVVNGVVGGSGGNDEELTPLTWLHDKNLLKGINLSKVPVSSPDSPRQVAGRLSPTSDFVEDSSVSEDNTSSANSSSDQGIGVYCTETIHPGGRAVHHTNLHHVQAQQVPHHTTFQLSNGSGHKTITTTIHGDTIIEYTADEKELKSPSSTVSCASSSSSSPPSSSNSSLYSSSSPSPNHPNTVVTSQGMTQNGGGGGSSSGGSGASTPHQHFHKKYLREEHVKQLKQVSSSYATPVKQQSSLKFDDGDLVDERVYPSAPIKNGGTGGCYTMAASPNVSSDEYSSTYGGSMKPPSPPLSPQQMGAATTLSGIHVLPQPPASPLPSPVGSSNGSKLSPPKAKHPTNVPYDPQVHVHSKPPFSFSSLIFMAIENCQQKALPVKEIYAWIVQHFPYFKTAPTGWKNSVRHNLSLNKCFQKVEKAANLGKGSLWMVEPQYRPNLIQALSRSPFHSGSGIDKTTYKAMQAQQQQQHQRSTDSPTSSIGSSYSKDNFPYLASRLAPGDAQSHMHHLHDHQQHPGGHPDLDGDDFSRSSTPIDYDGDLPHPTVTTGSYHVTYHPVPTVGTTNGITYSGAPAMLPNDASADPNGRNWSADTIDDVNAATAMLALKHGPKVFTEGFHNGSTVITKSPSEDHTYSAGGSLPGAVVPSERSSQANSDNNSNGTSSDAAYESSEESQTLTATDLEEQRRQAGVDALLNLAGITNYSTAPQPTPPNNSLKRPASSMLEPEQPSTPSSTAVIYHSQQYLESTPPSGYSLVVGPQQAHRNSYYLPAAEELNGGLHHQQYSSPSPPKKSKTTSARMLKKFKKKATWVR